MGHPEVARVLVGERRDGEGSKELAGGILQKTDADGPAEAFKAGAVNVVRIGTDGDRGDADDGAEVFGVGEVVGGGVAFSCQVRGITMFAVRNFWQG